jgi:hypothetical protein
MKTTKNTNVWITTVLFALALLLPLSCGELDLPGTTGDKGGSTGGGSNGGGSGGTPGTTPEETTPAPAPADGPVMWYISATDMPEGTAQGSGTTIKGALAQIKTAKSANKFAGKNAVIVIKGTITAATESPSSSKDFLTISGKGYYPPLVLRGDSTGGVVDAENKRRLLFLQDNTVTIAANLTLKNGRVVVPAAELTAIDNMGGGVYMQRSVLNMTGGAIANCYAGIGSAVAIEPNHAEGIIGTFNMSGGEIYGCTNNLKSSGGTVYVPAAQVMTFSGAARIHDNGADGNLPKGGGILLDKGKLTMSGGEIYNNKVSEKGGGVRVGRLSTFIMTGGTITKNTAPANSGGGVSYGDNVDTSITISGTAVITGNTGGDKTPTQF